MLTAGKRLGPYEILAPLGAGGMGEVYRARDTRLERTVALKVVGEQLAGDASARARLLREARAASALNHPNICTIYEVGEADGQTYIAMEYIEGRPLSALIASEGLPVETVLRYGARIADALAHAHERGLIHRDLKSSNVVITVEGRAKVLDFGLAKLTQVVGAGLAPPAAQQAAPLQDTPTATASLGDEPLTTPGMVVGTLAYLAPEVLRGRPADARSDLWALGVMLHEMASSRLPFQGQTGFELSSAILREPPAPLPSEVPPNLRVVISKCLAKEPGERYQRAGELRAALEAIQSGEAFAAVSRAVPRRWLLALVGAGLVGTLAVLVGLNVGGLRGRLAGRAGAPRIESIAVLPLENLSRDPEQEYFADGMTEELITNLAKIGALRVISRTSVMQYKGLHKSLPQIARELNVEGVIEGSVLRSGNRVRITAQLIQAATDKHLWAESYERDLRDVLTLQRDVARTIANEVNVKLTAQEQARLASSRPVDPEAHEAYLKGRYHWNKRTEGEVKKGIDYFQHAIAKDPNYAPAYSGLADCYLMLNSRGYLTSREVQPKAKEATTKALQLDDTLADGHASLAYVLFTGWDWSGAEREFKRAIELNPGYVEAHHVYSHFLMATGRTDGSLAESKRALELAPLDLAIIVHLGWHYIYSRQYDAAIDQIRKAIELDPNFALGHFLLGQAYERKAMYNEAIVEFQNAVTLSGSSPETVTSLGHAYAIAGRKAEAQKVLDGVAELSKGRFVSSYNIALVYAGLGENQKALGWLEKAYEEQSGQLVYLKIEPNFDNLRSDPRFQDLMRRMGLPP